MSWDTVYITGAGSGLGLWFCKHFLKEGQTKVVGIDRIFKTEVEDELKSYAKAGCWHSFICDISIESQVTATINQACDTIGTPNLTLHFAGMQRARTFELLPSEEFEQVIKVNLLGSQYIASAILPKLKAGDQFMFTASVAGIIPAYSYSSYAASKHAIVGLAGVCYLEYKPKDIIVSVVCPPEVQTPMVAEELKDMHPATRALKDIAATLTIDEACTELLRRLKKKQRFIVLGSEARRTFFIHRLFPNLLTKFVNHIIAKSLRQ